MKLKLTTIALCLFLAGFTLNAQDDQKPVFELAGKSANWVEGFQKNIGGNEFLSRFDFTIMIADFFNLDKSLISKIKTEALNQPARRPLKSGLITIKAQSELGYKPHTIIQTLELMKNELGL